MKWYAVVDKTTGAAVSFGTVLADPLPDHLEAIEIPEQPSKKKGTKWDSETRTIVSIPSVPPRDKVGEFLADSTVQAIISKLSQGERAALTEKLRTL